MYKLYGGTDAGLVRKSNQDRFEYRICSGRLAFAVLCDGMGGASGGNVASELATRYITEVLERELRPDMGEPSLRSVMMSAAAGANALVYEAARQDETLAGMGTTLIIAVFSGEHLYVAYAGDSRVYHVSDGVETRLTKDHTLVQMLLDVGEITEQDAQSHPKRHYITRAVGVADTVRADFLEHPMGPGDMALLCSDGLYAYLEDGSLDRLLRECVESGNVDSLLETAKSGGGADNITAVVAYRTEYDLPEGIGIDG